MVAVGIGNLQQTAGLRTQRTWKALRSWTCGLTIVSNRLNFAGMHTDLKNLAGIGGLSPEQQSCPKGTSSDHMISRSGGYGEIKRELDMCVTKVQNEEA